MRALAVVLHYGRSDPARNLTETLLRNDPGARGRVVVFDNASPAPYAGAWQRVPENIFWAGALELCLKTAREQGYTHLWFLNNDIRFVSPPPFLSRAEARLQRLEKLTGKTVGIWSPAVESSPYHPQMLPVPDAEAALTPLVDGIAPLINLPAVEDVGGLDAADNPRGYGVDMWLSLRLYRAGLLTLVDPLIRIRHKHQATARTIPGFMQLAARQEESFMHRRLGSGWREFLEQLKQDVTPVRPDFSQEND